VDDKKRGLKKAVQYGSSCHERRQGWDTNVRRSKPKRSEGEKTYWKNEIRKKSNPIKLSVGKSNCHNADEGGTKAGNPQTLPPPQRQPGPRSESSGGRGSVKQLDTED